MKPACHPLPSGDRTMARMLTAAMEGAGHTVETASRFSSFDAAGDPGRQRRLAALGGGLAGRLLHRLQAGPPGGLPQVWFTYHLYHKAPDWLGPRVSRGLGIPYVAAEASHAGKQAGGPWADGHAAAASAIAAADRIFCLNSADTDGIRPLLADPARLVPLPPFIDTGPFRRAAVRREDLRRGLCSVHALDPAEPLLLAIAMMRPGDKLASWRLLAEALLRLESRRWTLLIAGDGPARHEVTEAFAPLRGRVVWLGQIDPDAVPDICAAADLYAWPAIGEAWGMTLLEAQAAGTPVVAGRTGGVGDVVGDGETGALVPVGCPEAMAAAIARLLDDPARCRTMGAAAAARIAARHDLAAAGRRIDGALRELVGQGEVPG